MSDFSWISIFNAASLASYSAAIVFLLKNRRHVRNRAFLWLIGGFFFVNIYNSISNLLEWASITKALDSFEDYLEILEPILLIFIFYAFIQERYASQILKDRDNIQKYLDIVGVILVAIDRSENVVLINRKGCEVLGRPEHEILGKNWFENFVPISMRHQIKIIFQKISAGEQKNTEYFENPVLTAAGEERLIAWHNAILKDEHGIPIGTLSSGEDISERKKATDAMRELIAHEKAILDNIPHMAWVKDTKGVFLQVNRAFAEACGFPVEDILGKTDRDVWPEDLARGYMKDDQEVIRTKHKKFVEEPIFEKTGMKWFETFKSPIFDYEGNVIGTTGLSRDITARKQAEEALIESEEKYRTLVESANDAILLVDGQSGIVLDANKRTEDLIGYRREEIIGMHYTELHPKGSSLFYETILTQDQKSGQSIRMTGMAVRKDGVEIPVQISGSTLELRGKKIILEIFSDISELKAIEATLRKDKDGLKKLVDTKNEVLGHIRKELDHSKRLSDIGLLAATVAHELRNPLGVIKMAAYNIKRKQHSDQILQHLVNIEKKIAESEQIIKNLLGYSRIKMPRFEPVDVKMILKECIEHYRQRYSRMNVNIVEQYNVEDVPIIEADPIQITELLGNIIDNSFQSFNDSEGVLSMTLDYNARNKYCYITIHDNGVGIAKQDLPRVFEPFFTSRSKGTGLGLSVCQQYAELHNGKIEIDSIKSKGTTVKITLPIKH